MWNRLNTQRVLHASGQTTELPGDASRLNMAVEVLEDDRRVYLVLQLLGDDLCKLCAARPVLPDGRTEAYSQETARVYMKQVTLYHFKS